MVGVTVTKREDYEYKPDDCKNSYLCLLNYWNFKEKWMDDNDVKKTW